MIKVKITKKSEGDAILHYWAPILDTNIINEYLEREIL